MAAAWDVLSSGGSALDAVEAATREVEDNPADHTVGYGGYPNLVGVVELDASIMEGATRRAGAVGGLQGYRHAVTVARAVMDRLPHVLVAGEGAARLAAELGMKREELLTEEAKRVWQQGIDGKVDPASLAGRMLSKVAMMATDPDHAAGTVNVMARDGGGHIASAVSTSGWAWKYPGRLGDSPVIGAGNYCDDRHGAAACTGFGELAMRAGTARSVVAALQSGRALGDACATAMRDLADLGVAAGDVIMHLVGLDREEHHAGVTTQRSNARYLVQHDGMAEPELLDRQVIDL
jgi:beta-aspartyl-peptidase (threonine type)